MTFTEDEIRDLLAIADLPVHNWQVKMITDLLNSKGPVRVWQPRRSDAVADWLKRWRDEWPKEGSSSVFWAVLDDMLDDYRLHADTGRPLSEEVSEGREDGA